MFAHNQTKIGQKGDTIVEVMLATVIMSIVVMASFVLVNRATRINQLSSERSESTNSVQFQAETLRLLRGNVEGGGVDVWSDEILPLVATTPPVPNECADFLSGASTSLGASNALFIRDDLTLTPFDYAAPNVAERYYVWFEGYGSAAPNDDYVDFYIHSCWQGPGGTGVQQSSLVYRLAK